MVHYSELFSAGFISCRIWVKILKIGILSNFYGKINNSLLMNLNLIINFNNTIYCNYPIALEFKLIGRCRSKEDALSMTILFNAFIDDLNMNNKKKEKIKNDIKNN